MDEGDFCNMTNRDIRFLLKPFYSNSRALVIGVNEYEEVSPLSYAVSDAEAVRDALVGQLDFPDTNVFLLTDNQASRSAIMRAYLSLATSVVDMDERIIIFFAGHGLTRTGYRGEVGYLVPSDGDPEDLATLIRWDDLTTNADLVRAKHMFFIMDACYGGLALNRSLSQGGARFLRDMMQRFSRQVLTAGKADEEVSDSGGPLPNHSVFTGHLLEGIGGKAAGESGAITANGLMSYVYGRVSCDKNSRQTPHYGHFDGDGDFVLRMPAGGGPDQDETKGVDTLISVPFLPEPQDSTRYQQKVSRAKALLSNEESAIELHDVVVAEVKRFVAATGKDRFPVSGTLSKEDLLSRLVTYEEAVEDLSAAAACLARWGKPAHGPLLEKLASRASDGLGAESGRTVPLALRWYPLMLVLYSAGISAVEGRRYDSLASLVLAPVEEDRRGRTGRPLIQAATEAMLECTRADLFKLVPGHERHYAPMSEYLFKLLQPTLDDLLFLGGAYERAFDEFEILLALMTADLGKEQAGHVWGPIGRFGWKEHHNDQPPLSKLIGEAQSAGASWGPFRAGLFGGDPERFTAGAYEFLAGVKRLSWW